MAVLFHPKDGQLVHLLESSQGEVRRLFLVDNTPGSNEATAPVRDDPRVVYLPQGKNIGLAAAQNAGFRAAIAEGYTHVLLLDQDSTVSPGTVAGLLAAERELIAAGHAVAAVGAMYIDVKTGAKAVGHRYRAFKIEKVHVPVGAEPIETDWVIASGSLLRTAVLETVGLMRDDLFIDWVDTEWGLRAKSKGFRSFLVPKVTLMHSIGDHSVKLMGKNFNLHNDVRSCYMVRNKVFLLRLPWMGWRWRSYAVLNILYSFLTLTWTAKQRMRRARLLLRAMWAGLRGEMGPLFPIR